MSDPSIREYSPEVEDELRDMEEEYRRADKPLGVLDAFLILGFILVIDLIVWGFMRAL